MAMDKASASRDEGTSTTLYKGPKRVPCANASNTKALNEGCTKDGSSACSACGLVSYCSKECQKLHWTVHKKDCKDPMRSQDWLPGWIRESREPTFVQRHETDILDPKQAENTFEYASPRARLWGRMPACDVLNLSRKQVPANISIMFAASSDLRDVLRTVNRLPEDFSGNISISINDPDPQVVSRTLLLLAVLGTTSDLDMAADIALHLWYSVKLPASYYQEVVRLAQNDFAMKLLSDDGPCIFKFGSSPKLIWKKNPTLIGALYHVGTAKFGMDKVMQQMKYALFADKRKDSRERQLAGMEPSHRVAYAALRRSCVLLPFGADSSAFTMLNHTLFAANGRYLLDDASFPLTGWNVDEVIEKGKAHGAHRSDLFGCLYFYLVDELRQFAERIRRFNVKLRVFNVEAHDLAIGIPMGRYTGFGLSPRTRFDRVHTSNLIDANYSGLGAVLKDWTPLLNPLSEPSATIVGYFLNWAVNFPESTLQVRHDRAASTVIVQADTRGWLPKPTNIPTNDFLYIANSDLESLHPNASIFLRYLESHGLTKLCRDLHLRFRDRNTIASHRKGVPLGALNSLNPTFADREDFYRQVKLSYGTAFERYVEFCLD